VLSSAKRAMFWPLKEASSILSLVAWIISVTEVDDKYVTLGLLMWRWRSSTPKFIHKLDKLSKLSVTAHFFLIKKISTLKQFFHQSTIKFFQIVIQKLKHDLLVVAS
jgi:hypothetical protein